MMMMMNELRDICVFVSLAVLFLSFGCSKDSLNTLASCGNGVLELGEACDDGNLNANDQPYVCRIDCSEPVPAIVVKGPTEMASNIGFTDTPEVPLQHVHHMILCGENTQAISISNPGWADLTVSELTLTGPAQWVDLAELPLTIAPGETRMVPVSWQVGTTSLAVVSDAPGKERLRVYVEALADSAPTVSIVSPVHGTVLGEQEEVLMHAVVLDPEDSPETLSVVWKDQDGAVLHSGVPDSMGVSEFTWSRDGRVVGLQTVSVEVVDTCGHQVDTQWDVCQEQLAKTMGVWLVNEDVTVLEDAIYLGDILSYTGELSSVANYGYYSSSAHPVVGPEPLGFETNVYFYEGSDGLTLTFFSNLDAGGSDDSTVNWDIRTLNNDSLDSVLLGDEPSEIHESVISVQEKLYEARFRYWVNTDGGVIGPFVGGDFEVWVNVLESGDNTDAIFYSADGTSFSLSNDAGIASFAIAFKSDAACTDP
jgi:cysteine-rich repeat protein